MHDFREVRPPAPLEKGALPGCPVTPAPERGVSQCYAVPRFMDVSVRELRNHTARVVAAIEAGEPVALTVHGRVVADIVPRRQRAERRPTWLVLEDLAEISALSNALEVTPDPADLDTGLTTDDL